MMNLIFTAILWALATPGLLLRGVFGLIRRSHFLAIAYRPNMECHTCGEPISLVGMWACRCGYTYRGHVLRQCPVCQAWPRMVRCFSCGSTEVLPAP